MLTPRQSQVAVMVAAALGNKEIAARLELSEMAVKTHVKGIYRTLIIPAGVNRRVFLANQINASPESDRKTSGRLPEDYRRITGR